MRQLVVFLCGLLFSSGLIVSGMINPAKVIGFLDLFGQWDPSLAFVMVGAIVVTYLGYRLILKRHQPLFAASYSIPSRTDFDAPLLLGPILFGMGWGIVGLCPGPAIAALAVSPKSTWLFFVSMLVGMFLMQRNRTNNSIKTPSSPEAEST